MTAQIHGATGPETTDWPAPELEPDPDLVVDVPVRSLSVTGSPRTCGEDPEHLQRLAMSQSALPPIIVHHPTMRVIDGMHRLHVAQVRGDETIAARFFYGSEADAFVLAVKSNVSHGLPLSLSDRKTAAERIIKSHPQWSDRMIASVSGIAPRTVSDIRRRSCSELSGTNTRLGQDGRVRPLDSARGRALASEFITANPHLSLRQVARAAGISPETVRDVRNRLRQGGGEPAGSADDPPEATGAGTGDCGNADSTGRRNDKLPVTPGPNRFPSRSPAEAVQRLRADPSLRFSETGRLLLRLLYLQTLETQEWEKIGKNVPSHCSGTVAHLARECARRWQDLAEQVERRMVGTA